MKFIHALGMVLCLIGCLLLSWQAMAYVYVGQGLHPAIAAIGCGFLLACGYYASTLIDD